MIFSLHFAVVVIQRNHLKHSTNIFFINKNNLFHFCMFHCIFILIIISDFVETRSQCHVPHNLLYKFEIKVRNGM